MRFNSPPNWPPPPPGWSPGPGWQPDPRWGPPPPNWPFWVPERSRKGAIIAVCVALAVAVAVGAALTFFVWKPWQSEGEKFAAGISCEADDAEEEEVCDAIRDRYAANVDGDRERLGELTCSGGVAIEFLDEEIRSFQAAQKAGKIRLSITDMEINGDKARFLADIEAGGESLSFRAEWEKEDGQWKACSGMLPE